MNSLGTLASCDLYAKRLWTKEEQKPPKEEFDDVVGPGRTKSEHMTKLFSLLHGKLVTGSSLSDCVSLRCVISLSAPIPFAMALCSFVNIDCSVPTIESSVMREATRLHPPAAAPFMTTNSESSDDTVPLMGGKYSVPRGTTFRNTIRLAQKDLAISGSDADVFRPERMLDKDFNQFPRNAWEVCPDLKGQDDW